jgi:hypothetical protein
LNTGGAGYGFELEATTDTNPAIPGQTVDRIYFDGLGQKPFWSWSRTVPGFPYPIPQMELDGESNQLRLFNRTSTGAQIYLDPSVPEGRIGGWKILTEGTAKPWLEGQNLKVANLEVSGKVNGNLDISGGLTVRSNLIAYGNLTHAVGNPVFWQKTEEIAGGGGVAVHSFAGRHDSLWTWKVPSHNINVRNDWFVDGMTLDTSAFNTEFAVKHGWTGRAGVSATVTGPIRKVDVPGWNMPAGSVGDSPSGTHAVLRVSDILTGETRVQLSAVAPEADFPLGANRWPHGDATYLLNATGVGTKNPQEQLHVNGTARVDGALQLRAAANSPVPATISADAAGRVLLSVPARGGISMGSYGTP